MVSNNPPSSPPQDNAKHLKPFDPYANAQPQELDKILDKLVYLITRGPFNAHSKGRVKKEAKASLERLQAKAVLEARESLHKQLQELREQLPEIKPEHPERPVQDWKAVGWNAYREEVIKVIEEMEEK
jgi:hypothetical protein